MKRTKSRIGRLAAWLLLVCTMGLVVLGCTSSIQQAVLRYQETTTGPRLEDITVEQLQGCIEDHGDELEDSSIRVAAKVQVTPDGRIWKVETKGLPPHAQDFSACVQHALRNMTVPDLPLRSEETASTTDETAKPMGNEVANPAVFVELAVALSELLAQHGGKAAVFSVTIEVLSAAAIAGAVEYLRRIRNKCRGEYVKCIDSDLSKKDGKHISDSRCSLCRDICERNKGKWPDAVNGETCNY